MKRSDERRRDAPSVWENEGGATAPAAEGVGGKKKAAQGEGTDKIYEAAQDILNRGISEITSIDVAGYVKSHPGAAVAAAAGVGFVLGGGLLRPFATSLLRTGLRLALIPIAERLIVKALMPQQAGEAEDGEPVKALEEKGSQAR